MLPTVSSRPADLADASMTCAGTQPDIVRDGWCWPRPAEASMLVRRKERARREEAPAVSLSRRQLRTLRDIERDLACSDPRLEEFFRLFTGGFRGCEMPRAERVARWPSRMLAKLWRGRSVSEWVTAWPAENWHDP
jgi:hypothetical protein